MKTIRSEYAGRRILKKVDKVIFSLVLTLILVLIIPGRYHEVYAAPLEDCDLDGFDDATGVPVPWPGYDETKGDTPDGPAGSKKPTTASNSTDSTTVDNSNSETPDKTSSDASDKTNGEKSENANNTNSGKTNSEVKDKADIADSDKTSSGTSSKSNNKEIDNTSNTDSDKASSEAVSNADSTEQDNNKMEANNTSSIVQENSSNEGSEITDTTASSNTNGETADSESSSVSGDENNQVDASQSAGEQVESNSDNGETVNADMSSNELEAVINTKGTLEIADATGGIIHAGSSVIITGSGFAGSIQNLELQIQSEPIKLGSVESSANGSFEVQLTIPNDLEAGVHHIVVLYQDKVITHQQIEVGPRAADSFLQALTVGFTQDNNGLIPGLIILLGLFVSAIVVLGVNILARSPKAISKAS